MEYLRGKCRGTLIPITLALCASAILGGCESIESQQIASGAHTNGDATYYLPKEAVKEKETALKTSEGAALVDAQRALQAAKDGPEPIAESGTVE